MSFELPCRNCGKLRNIYEYIHPCTCWGGKEPEQADLLVVDTEALKPGGARTVEDYAQDVKRVGHRPYAGWTV